MESRRLSPIFRSSENESINAFRNSGLNDKSNFFVKRVCHRSNRVQESANVGSDLAQNKDEYNDFFGEGAACCKYQAIRTDFLDF